MNASTACFAEDARKLEQQNEKPMTTFVPQRNEERALNWVRWERYRRYHGVYVEALGAYWTYCGLGRRPAGVFDETTGPLARCPALPFPDALKALRKGAPNARQQLLR